MTSTDLTTRARSYLNVPWRHQGNTRDGLDCVGLMVAIARDFDIDIAYASNYNHRPDPRLFLEHVQRYCVAVPIKDARPGDVLFFRYLTGTWHVAMLTEHGMIHSTAQKRKVVEHRLDEGWKAKLRAVYRFKGVA